MNSQRQHPRLLFSARDGVRATLAPQSHPADSFPARVLNISAGGMGLALPKDRPLVIQPGQYLMLRQMEGHPDWMFLQDIAMEIKWAMQNDYLVHMAFGCEFVDLSRTLQEKIARRVHESLRLCSLRKAAFVDQKTV
jgi:c-di-GMP-binding flagellar brake protein YcgR